MAKTTAPSDAAPNPAPGGPAPDPDELAGLSQFVKWILLATGPFGPLEVALALVLRQPRVGAIGVFSVAYAGLMLLARRWLARGRLRAVVVLCSGGMLVFILAGALALPYLYPTVL